MLGNERNHEKSYKVLFKQATDEIPYKKVDFLTINGRAQGLGIAEMLFPLQERRNEMGNQKADSMRLSSKTLFQTRDKNISGNMLTDVLNGDIFNVQSEITQVPTEERNLGAYQQEENNVKQDIRDNANAQEILTGENLPSRTPFRLAALQQQNAGKLFEFIRENMGMFFEEVIKEWIVPEFEKSIDKDHVFQIYSRETLREVVKEDVNRRINEGIKKQVMITGRFPSQQETEVLAQVLQAKAEDGEKFAEIHKGYFKNFDKDLDIDVTGEKHDKQSKLETASSFMQLLAQNPAAMEDPRLRPLFEEIASLSGLNPGVVPRDVAGGGQAPNQATVGTSNPGVAPLAK